MNWFIVITITALSPHWDSDMNFSISVPELCLIRFCVREQTGLLSSDFVGQYTLPFTSLKKGERRWGGWESDKELNYIRWHCVTIIVFPFIQCQHYWRSISAPCTSFYENASVCLYVAHVFNVYTYISFHAPLLSPPPGYRWVPLRSRDGCSLDPASLFVFVWYS